MLDELAGKNGLVIALDHRGSSVPVPPIAAGGAGASAERGVGGRSTPRSGERGPLACRRGEPGRGVAARGGGAGLAVLRRAADPWRGRGAVPAGDRPPDQRDRPVRRRDARSCAGTTGWGAGVVAAQAAVSRGPRSVRPGRSVARSVEPSRLDQGSGQGSAVCTRLRACWWLVRTGTRSGWRRRPRSWSTTTGRARSGRSPCTSGGRCTCGRARTRSRSRCCSRL